MAKRKKAPDAGPSNAYLLSFGDTMTTLLAFFIVLNSLAEDQSGADLYRGTGSFARAMESMGLPGTISGERSDNVVLRQAPSPLYVVPTDDEGATPNQPLGPDSEDDATRVIDRESDEFKRFMNEMDRLFDVDQLAPISGEAVFDFFEPLPKEGPLVSGKYAVIAKRVLPMLHRENYHVEVVCWATIPSDTAWERAVLRSQRFANELAQMANLPPSERHRLSALGQPWFHREARRPILTIIVRKHQTAE